MINLKACLLSVCFEFLTDSRPLKTDYERL